MFLFLVEKGAPPVLYRHIYIKDCWHEVRSSLKCTPLAEKAALPPGKWNVMLKERKMGSSFYR